MLFCLFMACFNVCVFLYMILCLGKLNDVVLGYDSIKEYTVSYLLYSKTFSCAKIKLVLLRLNKHVIAIAFSIFFSFCFFYGKMFFICFDSYILYVFIV